MTTRFPGPACLLALPAALSLTAPAAAQNLITGNHTTGINLASYGAGPVGIAAGASLTASGWAGVWDNSSVALTNAGSITADNGAGVYLGGGGVVTNTGFVFGDDGVWLKDGGALSNAGSIGAVNYGVLANGPASVSNSGEISGGFDGVSLNDGGTVSNTGSIFGGHIGVYTGGGAGVVLNSGTISSRSGTGVSLYNGGTLTNAAGGAVLGGYNGAYEGGAGSVIVNAGLISGPHSGVYLTGASELTNTGTIDGGMNGVVDMGRGGTVLNAGLITSGRIGVRMQPGGYVSNQGVINGGTIGVELARGGTLENAGTISGLTGVQVQSGEIVDTGVIAATGVNAISLTGGASTLVLGTGAAVAGDIAGNGTASQISLTGTGTLDTGITGLDAGGALSIVQGANWTGGGVWDVANVTNSGTFTPEAGLVVDGNFTQTRAGTLRITVSPGAVSTLAVSGTATLAGKLVYVLAPGAYAPGTATFLTATGGVNGAFGKIINTQTQVMAAALHSTSFTPVAVVMAPLTMAAVAAPVAVQTAAVAQTQAVALQTVITSSFTVAPQDGALFPAMSQALGQAGLGAAQALLDHDTGCAAPMPGTGMAAALARGVCAAGGWVQGGGEAFTADGAWHAQGGNVLAGLDRPVATGGRVGIAVGFGADSLKDAAGSRAGFGGLRLGVYAVQPVGPFVVSAGLVGQLANATTTRATGAGDAAGKFNANVVSGVVQLAAPMGLFTPAAGLRIASVAMGRDAEQAQAAAFAVTAHGGTTTTVQPYARLTLARTITFSNGVVFAPAVSLGVSGTVSGPEASTTLTAADGTESPATARRLAPVAGEAGLGFSLGQGNWRLHAAYSAQVAGNFNAQSLQAGIVIRF